ncbi:MAG TPA: arsenite methyltransferase [Actinomycetota bacterium]|nr:arsenite methyltransferase [Actinomycetota bacterium]
MNDVRDEVRERYAAAAKVVATGRAADDNGLDITSCADGCAPEDGLGVALYDVTTRADLPEDAVLASMGCGNPTVVAELREGETVLDLGSGGGIDVMLSAKRVGPTGKAYGLDMTDEMLALARENAREAGAENVEFLQGFIEEIPMPEQSVDVIISNCVINLSTDKPRVVDEMFRVLGPGGRLGISDVVADDHLTPADRAERGSYVGCIAGALSFAEYHAELQRAGFEDIEIVATHELTDGMHGAIVRGVKPLG